MRRPPFSLPDDEDEEDARKALVETSEDRRRKERKRLNDNYPDNCPECGCAAFASFSSYYCTNRRCRWFDKKRLSP